MLCKPYWILLSAYICHWFLEGFKIEKLLAACSVHCEFMSLCLYVSVCYCPALRCKPYSAVYPSTRLHGIISQKHFVISVLSRVRVWDLSNWFCFIVLSFTWSNIFHFIIISSFHGGCFADNCFWVFTLCGDEMFWYFADNCFLGFDTVQAWNVLIFCR